MSILVHPDKNQDDSERAQQAFESKFSRFTFKLIYILYSKYLLK